MLDHRLESELVQGAFEACVQGISGLPQSPYWTNCNLTYMFLFEIPPAPAKKVRLPHADHRELRHGTKSYDEVAATIQSTGTPRKRKISPLTMI